MQILNLGKIYRIVTPPHGEGLMHVEYPGIFNLVEKVPGPCVYIEFVMGDAFEHCPLATVIEPEHLAAIKQGTAYLVLNNSYESFHHIVPPLYKSLVEKEGLDPERIILLSNSADIINTVRSIAAAVGHKPFGCQWVMELEMTIQQYVTGVSSWVSPPSPVPKLKKFVNFNRRWRPHRPAFVACMAALGTLEHGYVSLGLSDMSSTLSRQWVNIEQFFADIPEAKTLLAANHDHIVSLPPMYLDTDNLENPPPLMHREQAKFFHESYFSVVSETNFQTLGWEGGNRFFSEKTFKTIAFRHPFLLISVANSLPLLHELGYKTFSPWIDESYDAETNDAQRLWMIAKELQRLCSLPESELRAICDEMKHICEDNFHNLRKKKTFVRVISS